MEEVVRMRQVLQALRGVLDDSLIGAEEPRLVEGLLLAREKGRWPSKLMPCAQPQAH